MMSHLRRIAILIVAAVLLPVIPVAAQPQEDPDSISSILITVTSPEIIEDGSSWVDDDGLHARGVTAEGSVDGDLTGSIRFVSDLDWFGPCRSDGIDCDGEQESFSRVEISGDTGTWSGNIAVEHILSENPAAHGILIGRQGTDDQVIVIDSMTFSANGETQFAGRLVTLTGPVGGVHLTGSACLTGPTTADGGFIGSSGLIQDSGPLRVHREIIGGSNPTGIYGDALQIGQKGNVRGLFVAPEAAGFAHGNFVLVGESGPYAGMLGYGRATASLVQEPRCASGLQINSSWIGQARYLTNPASFLAPRVYFVSPSHGETVSNPITLQLRADHATIEPAGTAIDGAGYLTIVIDAPCLGPGEQMPDDDNHVQLVNGQTEHELNLLSGEHRLCLQLTDGAGVALPATDIIHILVAASGDSDPGNF